LAPKKIPISTTTTNIMTKKMTMIITITILRVRPFLNFLERGRIMGKSKDMLTIKRIPIFMIIKMMITSLCIRPCFKY
jgi:hypothetical protein